MSSKERPERRGDPLVSAGYQDLARERPPARLDEKIIREAHSAARPRYGRLRLWVRPVAWAATVVISLAIVLQLTQPPDAELPSAEPRHAAPAGRAVEQAAEAPAPRDHAEAGRLDGAGPDDADAFVPASVEVLREAEDMARLRSGSQDEAALPAAVAGSASTESALLEKSSEARFCDDEARETAAGWIACIEQLEADGKAAEAHAERLVFEAMYPDY